MDEMSVTQFAGELKMPANVLLEQLQKAGVAKGGVDELLTEHDKARLLDYLRRSHGETQPKGKITLTRKQTSEIRATDSSGRARTVQVEVRKKRVFVKRDELAGEAPASVESDVELEAEAVAPVAETPAPAPVEPPPPPPEPEVVAAPVESEKPAVTEVEAPVETEAPVEVEAPAEPVAAPRRKTRVAASAYLSPEEIASREAEEQRMRALRARQEADLKAKQERESAAAAARVAAAAAAAAEQQVAAGEEERRAAKGPSGTLHRPNKPEEREAGKDGRRGRGTVVTDAPSGRRR
jgi:translation initiation factor IF-2